MLEPMVPEQTALEQSDSTSIDAFWRKAFCVRRHFKVDQHGCSYDDRQVRDLCFNRVARLTSRSEQ